MHRFKIDKRTKIVIRNSLLKLLAVAIILGSAYIYGSFNPNKWHLAKLDNEFDSKKIADIRELGLHKPSIEYKNPAEFISSGSKCVTYLNLSLPHTQRVPRDIIIAMAVLETDYGRSRFAVEANNLFGIRTWNPSDPQLKPLELPDAKFGVKKYKMKCDSIEHMIDLLNTHHAYAEFRHLRTTQHESHISNPEELVKGVHKWSTNPEYVNLVIRTMNEVHDLLSKAK